jgi:osmotically-inducible protein OsmY
MTKTQHNDAAAAKTVYNYRHDPHELRELIESALSRSPYLSGRQLQCEVCDEDVVLRGVVHSYYQKQLAQESLRAIEGVTRIRNEIEVI